MGRRRADAIRPPCGPLERNRLAVPNRGAGGRGGWLVAVPRLGQARPPPRCLLLERDGILATGLRGVGRDPMALPDRVPLRATQPRQASDLASNLLEARLARLTSDCRIWERHPHVLRPEWYAMAGGVPGPHTRRRIGLPCIGFPRPTSHRLLRKHRHEPPLRALGRDDLGSRNARLVRFRRVGFVVGPRPERPASHFVWAWACGESTN